MAMLFEVAEVAGVEVVVCWVLQPDQWEE